MIPKIGISGPHLKAGIEILSDLLADETVLYIKTRKFHWNITGRSFMELHQLFQAQYTGLEATIDEVAERISKLGGNSIGTLQEFLARTRLQEAPGVYPEQTAMIAGLLGDHETVIVQLRKDIEACAGTLKDAGTADMLTGIMEAHETIAWKLRRYLK